MSYIPILFCLFLPFPSLAQGSLLGGRIAESLISEEILARQVEFLADSVCEGRGTSSRGSSEAAFWLSRVFSTYGLLPAVSGGRSYVQSFISQGKVGHNVIGFCPSSGPSSSYVIVAAHYDNIGTLSGKYYPGADSNASGVAAMLALAHTFRSLAVLGLSSGSNIIFVALDGKQLSMAGSNALYAALASGKITDPSTGGTVNASQVKAMVNLDILGGTLEPVTKGREDYLIMLSNDEGLKRKLSEADYRYRTGMDLSFSYYGSSAFTDLYLNRVSDQRVFLEHGIPSVLFTSGITMNTNKLEDTPDTLDFSVLRKRTILIYRWLEAIL